MAAAFGGLAICAETPSLTLPLFERGRGGVGDIPKPERAGIPVASGDLGIFCVFLRYYLRCSASITLSYLFKLNPSTTLSVVLGTLSVPTPLEVLRRKNLDKFFLIHFVRSRSIWFCFVRLREPRGLPKPNSFDLRSPGVSGTQSRTTRILKSNKLKTPDFLRDFYFLVNFLLSGLIRFIFSPFRKGGIRGI